ncbi:MAG: tetratricopeptide repeat protein [Bryobacteraceae bacterium]
MRFAIFAPLFPLLLAAASPEVEAARDRQDRAALEGLIARLSAAAEKTPDAAKAHYDLAIASAYLAEVSLEVRDRGGAKRAAERGIQAAERALALQPEVAEHHRVLATLCGQAIPANVLAGIGYGKRAQEAIGKAIERDPKSSLAYLTRGVGNYYLPPAFGGGVDRALQDFDKASSLNPKSAEAHLWRGLALRKANKNAEAREAFTRSLQLNPNRVWTKQQLEKTPAQ